MTCEFYEKCPIIIYVNKLEENRSKKQNREVKTLEAEYGCNIHKEVETA